MSEPRTSDRNVDRAIRSWLHEDRHEDISRVAGRASASRAARMPRIA